MNDQLKPWQQARIENIDFHAKKGHTEWLRRQLHHMVRVMAAYDDVWNEELPPDVRLHAFRECGRRYQALVKGTDLEDFGDGRFAEDGGDWDFGGGNDV